MCVCVFVQMERKVHDIARENSLQTCHFFMIAQDLTTWEFDNDMDTKSSNTPINLFRPETAVVFNARNF